MPIAGSLWHKRTGARNFFDLVDDLDIGVDQSSPRSILFSMLTILSPGEETRTCWKCELVESFYISFKNKLFMWDFRECS